VGTSSVRVEREQHVAIVTLDRPERRNALDAVMWSALEDAVGLLEKDLPRAVVVTGAGGSAFCAGMDVNPDNPQVAGLVEAVQTHDPGPVALLLERLRKTLDRLVGLPVPVIAAINGVAYGGGAELAARCDLRVMDPAAVLCFSEVRLGLMPDMGGGVALTRLIGPARAADLVLTARRVDAAEALVLGLVNRIAPPGMAIDAARDLARAIAKNGPRAVRAALEVIRRSADLTERDALDLELANATALIASGECATGIAAFLARSEPDFPDA
jgi:enoyl-CoA hydratase